MDSKKQILTPKEIKAIYNKTYYNKNKDKYIERSKNLDCEICRGSYNYYSKSRHIRSKRHLKFL